MTLEQIILYPLRGRRVSNDGLARMARDYANLQNAYDQLLEATQNAKRVNTEVKAKRSHTKKTNLKTEVLAKLTQHRADMESGK